MIASNPDPQNDWALDTNVLIVANGSTASQQTRGQRQNQLTQRRLSRRQTTRALFKCIAKSGVWNWSVGVAREYQVRGAISLQSKGPPPTPVPVQNRENATWVDHWMSSIENQRRMRLLSSREIQRLTGNEKGKLHSAQFRDPGDYSFLELARSSKSGRLVTKEADYNSRTIPAIRSILDVYCLDYQTALAECKS